MILMKMLIVIKYVGVRGILRDYRFVQILIILKKELCCLPLVVVVCSYVDLKHVCNASLSQTITKIFHLKRAHYNVELNTYMNRRHHEELLFIYSDGLHCRHI